jgi:hypothetical protein
MPNCSIATEGCTWIKGFSATSSVTVTTQAQAAQGCTATNAALPLAGQPAVAQGRCVQPPSEQTISAGATHCCHTAGWHQPTADLHAQHEDIMCNMTPRMQSTMYFGSFKHWPQKHYCCRGGGCAALPVSMLPSCLLCSPSSCRMHNMATFVLPAPVGAQTSMFSLLYRAQSDTRLWTRFRLVMPATTAETFSHVQH